MQGDLTKIQKGLEDWESFCEFSRKDEEEIKGFSKIYFKLSSLIFVRLISKFIQTSKLISNYHFSLEFSGLVKINFDFLPACFP